MRFLTVAAAMFTQGGEESVTLRRVAAAAEFSATTIYLHFPSKEALLEEVCLAEFASFAQAIQQAELAQDAIDVLRRVARAYADFGLQHPQHYRFLFMRTSVGPDALASGENPAAPIAGKFPALALPKTTRPYEDLQKAVFKAMAADAFKPEYRDVALIAQLIWSSIHGVVALHLVRAQHATVPWKPVDRILEASLETLINGLVVPSRQITPTWWKS